MDELKKLLENAGVSEAYTDHMQKGAWDKVSAAHKKARDSYPGGPEAFDKMKNKPTGPADHKFLNKEEIVNEENGMEFDSASDMVRFMIERIIQIRDDNLHPDVEVEDIFNDLNDLIDIIETAYVA